MSTKANNNVDVLKTLRGIFENNKSVNEKLVNTIEYVKKTFNANACACYISINNSYLEVFASTGFAKENQHKVSLRIGESLVGLCAKEQKTIKSANVFNDENFVYKKEMGDKELKAFLGVPLIKNASCIGVLTIRNKKNVEYSTEQMQSLEIISMLLADLIASPEMGEYKATVAKNKGLKLKDRVKGVSLSKGYGIGNAVVHKKRFKVKKIFADDKNAELNKLEKSYKKMIKELDEKFNETKLGIGDHVEIFEAYKMLASDKGWYKKIANNVEAGLSAEASVERVYEEMHARLSGTHDAYLKERLHDLRDISDRLQAYLNGDAKTAKEVDTENMIIVAQIMGPADLMDYDYNKIRGLIIEDGTPTMHVSIVAKALGIPVIAKIKTVFNEIKNGEEIAIDGNEGIVYLSPTSQIKLKFEKHLLDKQLLEQKLFELKKLPAKTKDRKKIGMYINVGLSFDLNYIEKTNADGIGLYRTEIPFMASDVMPNVDRQLSYYKEVIDNAGDKRVIFRSLDAGSDKLLPYWSSIGEENPAIGWRSIRITLDRRAILKKQLKAFIKATQGKELFVMFPMVANLSEFEESKETLMLEYEREKAKGNPVPKKIQVGLMIEVPSVIYHLDAILPKADFISIGTNDLAQFFFACDRGNPKLLERYDVLSAPFLRVMKEIIDKGNKYKVYTSVCGEMAGNPLEAMALIGLGYKNLSMSGSSYGKIKTMIRSMNAEHVEDYINSLLNSSKKTLRPQLQSYAYDHNIEI